MDEIWEGKIRAYRETLKGPKPDLDMALLFRILDVVNESSEVRVAVHPVDEEGGWSSSAPAYAVRGAARLDDGRIVLRVSNEKGGIEAGDLYTQLKKLLGNGEGEGVDVLYERKDKIIKLTDAYSHALVRQQWAGMPFDLVLAVAAE